MTDDKDETVVHHINIDLSGLPEEKLTTIRDRLNERLDESGTAGSDGGSYECPECGAKNEIDGVTVEFCTEYWENCPECGERWKFDFRGK